MKRILLNLAISVVLAIQVIAQPNITPPTNIVTSAPDAPWKNWVDNPLYITLAVQAVNVGALSNSTYSVTLSDATINALGTGCGYTTNSSVQAAHLSLNGFYTLTVVGTNLSSFEIDMDVYEELALINTHSLAHIFPKQYEVLVNGYPQNYVNDVNHGGCGYYSNTWNIQINQVRQASTVNTRSAVYNDGNFPDSAPGDGVWARIGPGKSPLTNHCATDWSVSLGHVIDGYSAGRLYFRENCLNSNTYMPGVLVYGAESTNIQGLLTFVVSDPVLGTLRQISAPQAFVDIVPTNYQFEIRFYSPTNVGPQTNGSGVYTNITGSAFVKWQIQNPDQNFAISNRLNIIEDRSTYKLTNQIVYNSTNSAWTLTQGSGTTQRLETRTITFSNPTNRVETVDIKYAGGTSDYHETETYQPVDGDWQIVQAVEDPAGAALTTSFAYYHDGIVTDEGRINSITYPDGRWEVRDYDPDTGELLYLFEPYMDSPADPSGAFPFDPADPDATISGPGKVTGYEGTITITALCKVGVDYGNGYQYDSYGYQDNGDGSATVNQFKWGIDSPVGEWYPLGFYSLEYTAAAGAGLDGHLMFKQPTRSHVTDFYYYDAGTYTNTINDFVVTNGGSDWRMTEIHFVALDTPSIGDGYVSVDGHTIPSSFTSWDGNAYIQAIRNRTTKEITIWRASGIIEKDTYVYTGGDSYTNPTFVLLTKNAYLSDTLGHTTNITSIDPVSSATRTIYSADWKGANAFDTDLKYSETDEAGMLVSYSYDSMKRVTGITTNGVSGSYPTQPSVGSITLYNSRGQTLSVVVSSGGLNLSNSWNYDLASRTTLFRETNGLVTTLSYQFGGRVVTQTNPGGATIVTDHYLDGNVKSKTGTGIVAEYHTYDTGQNVRVPYLGSENTYGYMPVSHYDAVQYGSLTSSRCETNCYNFLGSYIETATPDYSGTTGGYSALLYFGSTLVGKATNGMAMFGINRDYFDQICATGQLIDGSFAGIWPCTLDPNSTDRYITNSIGYEEIGATWYFVSTNQACLTDSNTTPTTLSTVLQQVNNLPSGVKSVMQSNDFYGNSTTVTMSINPSTKTLTQTTAIPNSTLVATNVIVNGLLESTSTSTVGSPTLYFYDALRRQTSIQSSLGFTSTTVYDPATGRVTSTTDPAGNATGYSYYSSSVPEAGRLQSQTAANGAHTYFDYDLLGNTIRMWGDVPYPQAMAYDAYGKMTNLQTFRGGSGWTSSTWPTGTTGTADTTTWSYQDSTGLLTNKTDAQGHSVSYTYVNNMLYTRTWSRGVSSTNIYNSAGDLTEIDYSDGSTPSVIFGSFNRAGLPCTITDAAGARSLTNDPLNRLVADIGTNGLFNGVSISNHFNSFSQRDVLKETGLGTTLETDYAYDGYGRLNLVTFGPSKAAYGYLANSDILQTTAFTNSSSAVLTTARQWNYGYQLSGIVNSANGATVTSDNYFYDNLNRHTRATLEDSSYWSYAYNNRNELTGANRYWSDFTPVTGQQYGYGFDNIGNRSSAQFGSVGNMQTVTYTPNNLNEYTSISTPGYKDIIGVAIATNGVTVNGVAADRKGEYYHSQITVPNSGGPVYQYVTNSISGGGVTGRLIVPGTNATPKYDVDGNLTFDGVWNYYWDAENRLISMKMTNNIAGLPISNRYQLDFKYDYMNRRISKVLSTNTTGETFVSTSTNYFVYDGWNVIGVFVPGKAVQQACVWGLDLSMTTANAGGIGGLLMVTNSGTNYFTTYDGNGNITGLINASTKATTARYEYSPFGEPIRVSGPAANANPFRFSSKFTDIESGLVYYGYRYYVPTLGRWIGRDPSGEQGGLHLYAFLGNQVNNGYDPDGQRFSTYVGLQWATMLGSIANQMKNFISIYNNPAMKVTAMNPLTRLAAGSAYAVLETASAIFDGAIDILDGGHGFAPGSTAATAEDLLEHSLEGDTSWADLDAATLAAQVCTPMNDNMTQQILSAAGGGGGYTGYATSDANTAWLVANTVENEASP